MPVAWIESGTMTVNCQGNTDNFAVKHPIAHYARSILAKVSLSQVRHEDISDSFHAYAKINGYHLDTTPTPVFVPYSGFTYFYHYTGTQTPLKDIIFFLEVNGCEATAVWEVIYMSD